MRTLRFIVENNNLKMDPSCDFSGLFPGSNPNVKAEFIVPHEWTSCIKVAAFWSMLDKEYPPQILDEDNSCMIPTEALSKPAFKLQLFANNRGKVHKTNTVTVYQRGGKT